MTKDERPERGRKPDRDRDPARARAPGRGAGGKKPGGKPFGGGDRRPRRAADNRAAENEESGRSERIARRLARAGIASRREAETIIAAGRVSVNGTVLTSPAFNVSRSDMVLLDGKPLPAIERTRLWLYHKPEGLVTTHRDPEDRPTVFDALPEGMPRVMSVGRLDINTEGLLLLTNDGGLARVLELPATGWLRRYRVRAHGTVTQEALDRLKDGIAVDGVFYGAVEARLEREQGSNVWIEIGLREGKNREVKNILGSLGLDVNRLIRISFGPFQLGDLEPGSVREIRGRTLRDQLGERLIEEAGCDFDAPVTKPFPNEAVRAGEAAAPASRDEFQARRESRPAHREKEWVSSGLPPRKPRRPTEDKGEERRGENKRADRREEALSRLSTRAPSGDSGRKRREGEEDRQPKPRQRSANVWMAPGARPGGKKAKPRPDSDAGPSADRNEDGKWRGAARERPAPEAEGSRSERAPRWQGKPGGKPASGKRDSYRAERPRDDGARRPPAGARGSDASEHSGPPKRPTGPKRTGKPKPFGGAKQFGKAEGSGRTERSGEDRRPGRPKPPGGPKRFGGSGPAGEKPGGTRRDGNRGPRKGPGNADRRR